MATKIGVPTKAGFSKNVSPAVVPSAIAGGIYGIGAHAGVIGALVGGVLGASVVNDETISKIIFTDFVRSVVEPR